MSKLFERLVPAPLDQRGTSLDACAYFYRFATVLGWMPPEEGWPRWIYFLLTSTTMLLGLVYLPLGLTLTYVKHFDRFTPMEFLTSLQVDVNCVGNVIKTCVTFPQMWRMRRMNELIAPLDKSCRTPRQRQILHNVVARVNRIMIFFMFMYFAFSILTLFTSVAAGKAPWQLYNPFLDWKDGPWQLWVASILEFIVVGIGESQELLSDMYPIVFISLFRAHLAVLKDRIENLRQDEELSEEESYEQLVACIQDHRTIIQCSEVIRPMLSVTVFAQFMLIGIVLGVAGFNMLFFPNTIWMILSNIVFILAICTESFPFCLLCEFLLEDCSKLTDALFHSNWLTASRRYKSTVIYFLHRAQQPIKFMAGSIFTVSVQSNITVAKFAFSIITIINQMNLGEKFKRNMDMGDQEP